MKINKKSSMCGDKSSVKTSGCGCGSKHSGESEYEIEETEIEVSK